MTKINSKIKGNVGERELAKILREHGYIARRGQQYNGRYGDPDVVGLPGILIECKRVEKLNIYKAMEQAVRDASSTENTPAVFHRRNRRPWLVTMRLEDWLRLYKDAGWENET